MGSILLLIFGIIAAFFIIYFIWTLIEDVFYLYIFPTILVVVGIGWAAIGVIILFSGWGYGSLAGLINIAVGGGLGWFGLRLLKAVITASKQ